MNVVFFEVNISKLCTRDNNVTWYLRTASLVHDTSLSQHMRKYALTWFLFARVLWTLHWFHVTMQFQSHQGTQNVSHTDDYCSSTHSESLSWTSNNVANFISMYFIRLTVASRYLSIDCVFYRKLFSPYFRTLILLKFFYNNLKFFLWFMIYVQSESSCCVRSS